MADPDEIRKRLMKELEDIRQQIAKLETVEARRKHAEKYWAEAMALLVGRLGASEDKD